MSIWKLRLSMIGTLTVIIGLSTLVFTVVLSYFGVFSVVALGFMVVAFNIIQWLISPYIINAIYRTRELSRSENPKLYGAFEELSRRSRIKKPKLMLAQIPIPNAFAYGSPIAGNYVAVTRGLLETLEHEEVEAVIGHELGHLKHRDVQVMMFVSLLPALLYYIGYSLMLSSMFHGYGRRREGGAGALLLGVGFMVFSWILNLFVLYLSRLREYYADRHSASIVEDGPRKLSEGLAKIVYKTRGMGRVIREAHHLNAFKALFITDPDHAVADSVEISGLTGDQRLVREILSRRLTLMDKILEMFSTHPNIVKRLRALQKLS